MDTYDTAQRVLLAAAALLACLNAASYFAALRPRRGTTEWLARFAPVQPVALPRPAFSPADLCVGALALLCAACLRLVFLFFDARLHLSSEPWEALVRILPTAAEQALLAPALYALLRGLFSRRLPAFFAAVLGVAASFDAVFPFGASGALACLAVSLLLLLLWMTSAARLRWLYLLGCGVLYGLAALLCFRAVYLLPLYAAAYVLTLVRRSRQEEEDFRPALSVLAVAAFGLVGGLLLWAAHLKLRGLWDGGYFEIFRSFRMYRLLGGQIRAAVSGLFGAPRLCLSHRDGFLLLFGAAALVPLVHGAFWRKEALCRALLLLTVLLFAAWLFGGAYLLPLALLAALCRVWSVACARGRTAFAVLGALALFACHAAALITDLL